MTRYVLSDLIEGEPGVDYTVTRRTTTTTKKGITMPTTTTTTRPLYEIAEEIAAEWRPVNYAAKPYLEAMLSLDSINDMYGADRARDIVAYFLSNARTWKGETARRIKAELNAMIKR